MKLFLSLIAIALLAVPAAWAAAPEGGFYMRGVELYKAGRYSDATESFEQAMRKKDNAKEAQAYIERIRKETVERIRNRALTGVPKNNWQTKYYFMNEIAGRVRVGISMQELFERDSVNFRPGAIDALDQLAATFARAEATSFDVELINELNTDAPVDIKLAAQQQAAVYSFLSLSARNNLPRF